MKIQLKRSAVLDGGLAKEPTPAQMEYGELAVNYSDSDPAIFLKDTNNNIVRIAGAGANGNIEIPGSGSGPHQPGTSDDRYIEITGDNMTGDLTLGTDKITLDAGIGNATFAGLVDAVQFIAEPSGGGVVASRNTDDQQVWRAGSKNFDMLDTSTYTSEIMSDGSASFAGDVQVGLDASGAINSGLYLNKTGRVTAVSTPGTQPLWTGYTTGNTNNTSQILANGSASFDGVVDSSGLTPGYITATMPSGQTESNWGLITGRSNASTVTSQIRGDGSATFEAGISVRTQDAQRGLTIYSSSDSELEALAINANGGARKILLNHDGSAEFKGSIQQGLETSANPGNLLYAAGGYYARFLDGSGTALQVKNGSADSVLIKSDGNATFAGDVYSSGSFEIGVNNNRSHKIDTTSNNWAQQTFKIIELDSNGAEYTRLSITGKGASDSTAAFDGSADFAGDVTSGGGPALGVIGSQLQAAGVVSACRPTGFEIWYGYEEGSSIETSRIRSDGSADFAGDVQVGGDAGSNPREAGVYQFKDGAIAVAGPSAQILWNGYVEGTSAATSTITADGALTLSSPAGDTGEIYITGNLANVGGYYQQKLNAGVTGGIWRIMDATSTDVVRFSAEGNASFAGQIDSGDVDNTNGVRIYNTGAILIRQDTFGAALRITNGNPSGPTNNTVVVNQDGSASFGGAVTASNITVRLEADDDTKYTSTTDVDEEGNETVTRVYNGAVLDVKDRLTKADAALQSLKTAAAAATDFASLQSAITTALANI